PARAAATTARRRLAVTRLAITLAARLPTRGLSALAIGTPAGALAGTALATSALAATTLAASALTPATMATTAPSSLASIAALPAGLTEILQALSLEPSTGAFAAGQAPLGALGDVQIGVEV